MPRIQQLSQHVVNKIAAGEVIERPSSVVKELLENSIDAGSTRIEIAIIKGGTESIKISDNGCGIERDQLVLAATSHATSKIRDAEELFSVATMGFRGEALASIGSVSHMRISSHAENFDSGATLEINGGDFSEIEPCGMPHGTTVEVRDLFYNTPVRRKFLRTTQTEMSHIVESFTRIALAHQDVHLTLRHNERVVHDLPPTAQWDERIGHFFGPEIQQALIPVESNDGTVSIAGFVCDPTQSRGNNKLQYLFLNCRHIKDRSLQHALTESYRGLLLTGRYPICFLNLEMPTQSVDVNVHPAKLEVRFQDGSRLYSQLLSTIREKFLTTDLTARARLVAAQEPDENPISIAQHNRSPGLRIDQPSNTGGEFTHSSIDGDRSSQRTIEFAQTTARDWTEHPIGSTTDNSGLTSSGHEFRLPSVHGRNAPIGKHESYTNSTSQSWDSVGSDFESIDPALQTDINQTHQSGETHFGHAPPSTSSNHTAIQVQRRYLVAESGDGMIVIDQHALHERILYEQLREKVLAGTLETQALLVPSPVNLSPSDLAMVLEFQEELTKIGVEIEHFGGKSVVVNSYPAILSKINPAEMLRSIVEMMNEGNRQPEKRDILDELLHMMSCKAAVKAGDSLSPEEIEDLLIHRDLCQDSHHCPHGRPTSLHFSRKELDRKFKRI